MWYCFSACLQRIYKDFPSFVGFPVPACATCCSCFGSCRSRIGNNKLVLPHSYVVETHYLRTGRTASYQLRYEDSQPKHAIRKWITEHNKTITFQDTQDAPKQGLHLLVTCNTPNTLDTHPVSCFTFLSNSAIPKLLFPTAACENWLSTQLTFFFFYINMKHIQLPQPPS